MKERLGNAARVLVEDLRYLGMNACSGDSPGQELGPGLPKCHGHIGGDRGEADAAYDMEPVYKDEIEHYLVGCRWPVHFGLPSHLCDEGRPDDVKTQSTKLRRDQKEVLRETNPEACRTIKACQIFRPVIRQYEDDLLVRQVNRRPGSRRRYHLSDPWRKSLSENERIVALYLRHPYYILPTDRPEYPRIQRLWVTTEHMDVTALLRRKVAARFAGLFRGYTLHADSEKSALWVERQPTPRSAEP